MGYPKTPLFSNVCSQASQKKEQEVFPKDAIVIRDKLSPYCLIDSRLFSIASICLVLIGRCPIEKGSVPVS